MPRNSEPKDCFPAFVTTPELPCGHLRHVFKTDEFGSSIARPSGKKMPGESSCVFV